MQEKKKQHLDMIQGIITRMASNSFLIKGWSISLISAILIFADSKNNPNFIFVTLLPAFSFWFLDAYYLQLERKFRELYKKVQDDYVNNTNIVPLFDMNIKSTKVDNIFRIMISKSIWPLHLIIVLIIAVIMLIVSKSIWPLCLSFLLTIAVIISSKFV